MQILANKPATDVSENIVEITLNDNNLHDVSYYIKEHCDLLIWEFPTKVQAQAAYDAARDEDTFDDICLKHGAIT